MDDQRFFDREFAGIWLWWIWTEQIRPFLDIVRPWVDALTEPAQQQGDTE